MNILPKFYFTMETYLFPQVEKIWQINRQGEGIFANYRSSSPVPFSHQCVETEKLYCGNFEFSIIAR